MLRSARFALVVGLSASIPVVFALDPHSPPNKQAQNKQEAKDNRKQVEPAKKDGSSKDSTGDDRLDRRNSRMKERNREIDGLVNKQKN